MQRFKNKDIVLYIIKVLESRKINLLAKLNSDKNGDKVSNLQKVKLNFNQLNNKLNKLKILMFFVGEHYYILSTMRKI
jgi:hypothetical protein